MGAEASKQCGVDILPDSFLLERQQTADDELRKEVSANCTSARCGESTPPPPTAATSPASSTDSVKSFSSSSRPNKNPAGDQPQDTSSESIEVIKLARSPTVDTECNSSYASGSLRQQSPQSSFSTLGCYRSEGDLRCHQKDADLSKGGQGVAGGVCWGWIPPVASPPRREAISVVNESDLSSSSGGSDGRVARPQNTAFQDPQEDHEEGSVKEEHRSFPPTRGVDSRVGGVPLFRPVQDPARKGMLTAPNLAQQEDEEGPRQFRYWRGVAPPRPPSPLEEKDNEKDIEATSRRVEERVWDGRSSRPLHQPSSPVHQQRQSQQEAQSDTIRQNPASSWQVEKPPPGTVWERGVAPPRPPSPLEEDNDDDIEATLRRVEERVRDGQSSRPLHQLSSPVHQQSQEPQPDPIRQNPASSWQVEKPPPGTVWDEAIHGCPDMDIATIISESCSGWDSPAEPEGNPAQNHPLTPPTPASPAPATSRSRLGTPPGPTRKRTSSSSSQRTKEEYHRAPETPKAVMGEPQSPSSRSVASSHSKIDSERDELLLRASQHEANGEHLAALSCYEKCLALKGSYNKSPDNGGVVLVCPSTNDIDKNNDDAVIADVLHKMGVVHWKAGAYDSSLKALTESLSFYKGCLDPVTPEKTVTDLAGNRHNIEADTLAEVLNGIGRVHQSLGEYTNAMRFYQRTLAMQRTAYATDDCDMELTSNVPSLVLSDDGGSSTKKRRKRPVINHPSVARTTICIGMVHEARGKFNKAMKNYREGLRIQRLTLGEEHVDVAATLNSIGVVHEKWGEYDLAMECYSEALWIYRTQLGNDHVDVAVTLNNTGQVHHHWNEYDEAMNAYLEALRVMKAVLGMNHRNVAATMHNIGLVHTAKGSYDKALKIYREVLKSQRAALGDDHVDVAVTLDSIGAAYEKKEKLDKAIKFYGKALRVRRGALGKKHLFVAMTLDRMGVFHLEKDGDLEEAKRRLFEARDLYEANGLTGEDARLVAVMEHVATVKNREVNGDEVTITSTSTGRSGSRSSSRRRRDRASRRSRKKRASVKPCKSLDEVSSTASQ